MTDLIHPTVHLNGTPRERLIEQNRAALDAIGSAIVALGGAGPHGRDYYPQDGGAVMGLNYMVAAGQHCKRLAALLDIQAELRLICETLAEGRSLR